MKDIEMQDGKWVKMEDYSIVSLFIESEVVEILSTKDFIQKTKHFLEDGTFDFRDCVTAPWGKKVRYFWTMQGLNKLKEIYLIPEETEKEFCALYFFLSESIGDVPLSRTIASRHNLEFPHRQRKDTTIKAFLSASWGNFAKKDKQHVEDVVRQMRVIKLEIEEGRFMDEKIKRLVKYEDMIL